MTSFGTLARLEFAKAIRRPMTWILMVIFVGFLGFMYIVLTLASLVTEVQDAEGTELEGLDAQLMLPEGLSFGSALVVGVGAVVMIIFAAGLFGSEFSWATIRTILLMRGPRVPLVFAKLLIVFVMSSILTIIGMVIAVVGSIAVEIVIGENGSPMDHMTGDLIVDALVITGRSIVAVAVWALIGGMLALALSSMAIGTGIALASYFVGDLSLTLIAQTGTVGEWVVRLSPTYGVNGLVQMNQASPPEISSIEVAGMVLSLIVWSTIIVAFGIYRFRNMDVIAASN